MENNFKTARNTEYIYVAMSDRVARLAEIRRKRKAQEQGVVVDLVVLPVVENVVTEKLEEEPVKDHVTGLENDAKKEEKNEKEEEKEHVILGPKEKTASKEEVENVLEEKVEVEASNPNPEIEPLVEKVTYNSDLKRDLAPYLKQAKLETDRALNRILQEKYQQAARANKEDA